MEIKAQDVESSQLYGILAGAVQPRPIAFASTVDKDGKVNLSPYSFYNVLSVNPPVLVFSPLRRMRDNTTKDTLENARETGEIVINVVNYDLVQQMSLASTEYDTGVNEFIKSGLTARDSVSVKPPRVAESPVQFECNVIEIKEMGQQGGAGNLIFCEVQHVHVDDEILDENNDIDPFKIDTVARMGGNWYCRSKDAMFEVAKPLRDKGVGVDALPDHARDSEILSGNDLGKLGNVKEVPEVDEVQAFAKANNTYNLKQIDKHKMAKTLIANGHMLDAWKILLQ
ncbi:flavin reductase family protein [Nonlabens ponticola]|uniref:Flavin reductase family protein n=1 Tax=Nonlabens ponticola TaxID=2496866 RepID=A0A3S9MUY0_9FLAO|nr:flavin reductase family protein [Nonlabens ponticola]AZQ42984.1 flavin reductase family protein [Nonlabens ponticola]